MLLLVVSCPPSNPPTGLSISSINDDSGSCWDEPIEDDELRTIAERIREFRDRKGEFTSGMERELKLRGCRSCRGVWKEEKDKGDGEIK